MRNVQIQRDDGQWYWAEYSTFSISDEVGKYQLTVDGYSGDAGDALAVAQHGGWNANGMMFSTVDSDNDGCPPCDCASFWGVGWWYNWCTTSVLSHDGLRSWTTGGPNNDVQASRMLVKVI